jgi:hypothetical protein
MTIEDMHAIRRKADLACLSKKLRQHLHNSLHQDQYRENQNGSLSYAVSASLYAS